MRRPGFRITELQISKTQKSALALSQQRAGHVLRPRRRAQDLAGAEGGSAQSRESRPTPRARRPHLVTNGGEKSATFLVLQGIGEYDFVPLVEPRK